MAIQVGIPYKNYPFWYKGETHVHSDLVSTDSSDEAYSVEKTYHDYGYDFICLTDHDHGLDTGRLSPTEDPWAFGILHIRSAESGWEDRHHMLYLGIDRSRARWYHDHVNPNIDGLCRGVPDCDAHDCGNIQTRIDYALATGSLPVLAHPTAGVKDHGSILRTVKGNTGYTHQELLGNSGYTGIEIYCDGIWSIAWWDKVLRLGKDRVAWGFASDDCENIAGSSFNRGWTVVNSSLGPARDYLDGPREDELRQDILENIRRGNFYAVVRNPGGAEVHGYGIPDRGPAMNISTIDSTIVVQSDPDLPCEEIRFLPNGVVTPEFSARGVTYSQYEVRGDEIYVRIEIDQIRQDGELYRAFSQPLFVDF